MKILREEAHLRASCADGYFLWQQALQNAVDRLTKYVVSLEDKMEALERKKK